ncbi:MAG: tripartite tricarboxylate transporter substrate binding protein [Burkholderiales bacterium]|nr:tripartite tricarboxylate transporter substrate binding protein [Burkholderiales bacterium]
MNAKLSVMAMVAAAMCAAAVPVAAQQAYPNRPVRLIVPFPPGGSNDIVGRLVGAGLAERLGKQVVIDNRAGGNSIIGTEMAAKSPPDGHTLLVISTSFTTNPIIHKLPYDPRKDFAWVAMLGSGPNVLAVTNSLPVKTVPELIALAKAKPDFIIYASTGVGSNAHFGTELFKHMTGTRMLHVPYKGGGPALLETIAGQAHICLSSLIQAIGHMRAGRLRGIATSGAKRSITVPEIPTIAESGVPGYDTANWWGIAVPRGTSPAIIRRVNDEVKVVLENPDTIKRMINEGAEPMTKTPEELGRHVIGEMDKWVKVAQIAGIKGE